MLESYVQERREFSPGKERLCPRKEIFMSRKGEIYIQKRRDLCPRKGRLCLRKENFLSSKGEILVQERRDLCPRKKKHKAIDEESESTSDF